MIVAILKKKQQSDNLSKKIVVCEFDDSTISLQFDNQRQSNIDIQLFANSSNNAFVVRKCYNYDEIGYIARNCF